MNTNLSNTPNGGPLIYNVTTQMDWQIHDAWLQWMLDAHIPAVLGTGCFEKHQVVRILEIDDTEGPTYAVQYYAGNRSSYDNYVTAYAARFRKEVTEKWGNNLVSFRSIMGIVQ